MVGLPNDNLSASIFWTVLKSINIVGSYVGNRQDAVEALDIAARGKVKVYFVTRGMSELREYVPCICRSRFHVLTNVFFSQDIRRTGKGHCCRSCCFGRVQVIESLRYLKQFVRRNLDGLAMEWTMKT